MVYYGKLLAHFELRPEGSLPYEHACLRYNLMAQPDYVCRVRPDLTIEFSFCVVPIYFETLNHLHHFMCELSLLTTCCVLLSTHDTNVSEVPKGTF